MSENDGDPRPDFDERLRQVARKRQGGAQTEGWEPEDDSLSLSSRAKADRDVFTPGARPAGMAGGDGAERLLWVAVGLGAAALVLVLILGILLLRQGNRVEALQESVALLEEQAEAPADDEAALRAEIARLNARLDALQQRVETAPAVAPDALAALEARTAQLESRLEALQPRLDKLEKALAGRRAAARTPPPRPAASGKGMGWYVVVASLSDRQAAEKLQRRYRQQGVAVSLHPVTIKGRRWYRLRVGPFPDQAAARREAARLKRTLGLSAAWLSR